MKNRLEKLQPGKIKSEYGKKKKLPPNNYSQYCGELLVRLEYDENTKEYTKD